MVLVPALGLGEVEAVLAAIPDVEKKAENSLLCSREREAIGESVEISGLEIRRQVTLGHMMGDSVESGCDLAPFVGSGHGSGLSVDIRIVPPGPGRNMVDGARAPGPSSGPLLRRSAVSDGTRRAVVDLRTLRSRRRKGESPPGL